MTDLTQAIAEGRETRMQVRRWFVETGWVDGNGIGLWDGTDESVEVSSRAVAEALRDEWLASGKIERDQWGNLRRTGPYGDFRIRSVWDDVPGELIPLADAKLAVAMAVERAAACCPQDNTEQHLILALADTDALAEVQALRDERDNFADQIARLEAHIEGTAKDTHKLLLAAEAELAATQAKLARVVEAIGTVAEEATSAEIPAGFMPQETPDWHRGYDAAIHKARAAIEGAKPVDGKPMPDAPEGTP